MQRTQQLRTATQTRRSARTGFPEPDDFEGLPVRQWRQEWVTVAPSLQQELAQQGDRWAAELPYGMPRESHLLPPHSQELLRAARSGRLYKRPAPAEEEEPDAEVDPVKGEKKDWDPPSEGYMVKMWKQVPRNAESPTIAHLAKRHKHTVTLSSRAAPAPVTGPTVIRATVRRIDAAGNPYEQTVTLTEGQKVDGEIVSTTVVPAPSAAQSELPIQQTTPVRRRPPPPKRKAKGVGRGRKKGKLPLPLPATRSQASAADGASLIKPEDVGTDQEIKTEDAEDSTNHDSEMADMSGMPSEDEEGDGGEGEDDEEDVEEEGGDVEGEGETPNVESTDGDALGREAEDSEMSEVIQPSSVEEAGEHRPPGSEEEAAALKARLQPPALASLAPPHPAMHLGPSKIEGSPLKNVMTQSPTEPASLISQQAANTSFSASGYMDVQSGNASTELSSGITAGQAYATETTVQGDVPQLGDDPAADQAVSQDTEAAAFPAETSPPLPAGELTEASAEAPDQSQTAPGPPPGVPPSTGTSEPGPETANLSQPEVPDVSLQPPDSPSLLPTVAEDEDDGLNLLGSLERELDRQEGMSSTSSASEGKVTPSTAATATTSAAAAATTESKTPVVAATNAEGPLANATESQAQLEDASSAGATAEASAVPTETS